MGPPHAFADASRQSGGYKLGIVMSPVPSPEMPLRAEARAVAVPRISIESVTAETHPIQLSEDDEDFFEVSASAVSKRRLKQAVAAGWVCLVLLALIAANPAVNSLQPAAIVLSVVVVLAFLASQAILLLEVEEKFQHWQLELLAILWIELLCLSLSLMSSPGRRDLLGGEETLTHWREDPGNSAAVLWIIMVLFLAAVTVELSFSHFVVLGQVVALQHLLIGALIMPTESPCSESSPSFGGVSLALPPWLVPALQLHVLALGLSLVRLWQEKDAQVRTAIEDYLEGKEVPDVLAPGAAGAIKTRIEMITELLDSEIDFLRELMQKVNCLVLSQQAHVDWLRASDFLLDLLQSCADVLKQTNSTDEYAAPFQEQLTELGVTGWTGAGPTTARTVGSHASPRGGPRDRTDSEMSSRLEVPGLQLPGQLSPQGSFNSLRDLSSASGEPLSLPVGRAEDVSGTSFEPSGFVQGFQEDDVRSLYGVADWAFDALQAASQVGGVLKLVGREFLGQKPWLPQEHLPAFLDKLESRYLANNPYHSNVHAADMANSVFFMLENCGLQDRCDISETSVTTMMLAALGHDVGHPGYNNNFLINARHDHAVTYSDRSVLENFHAAELIRLLSGDVQGVNFLNGLAAAEQKQERFWMTSLILSTDMSKLMQDLSSLRMKISSGTFTVEDPSDQQLVMSWLFRSADIGHSAKPWKVHEAWSMRVVAEFHQQGDEEIRLGLPVSPLCARTDFKLGKSQAGFLQFVCLPTFLEIKNMEEILCQEGEDASPSHAPTPAMAPTTSNASALGGSPSPAAVQKTRTDRHALQIQGGGQGRRRSIAQLVGQKSRADLTSSPTPQVLASMKSPENSPRTVVAHRHSLEYKSSNDDSLRVPGSESHRRASQGPATMHSSSSSRARARGGWSKSSTNSSLGNRTRTLNTRVYLQCKENMETWQKLATEEETGNRNIAPSPNVSKGSASLAPLSDGSSDLEQ